MVIFRTLLSAARRNPSAVFLCSASAALGSKQTICDQQYDPDEPKPFPPPQQFRLSDGRTLSYHTIRIGGPGVKAVPVLALHGMGLGCGLGFHMPALNDTSKYLSLRKPVRFICIDRPGYGASSPPPSGYSYSAFVRDIEEFVEDSNCWGAEKFCVLGQSSGGPNALAVASILGQDRVAAAAIVSSDPPYAHPRASQELRDCDRQGVVADGIDGWELAQFADNVLRPVFERRFQVPWNGCLGWANDFTLERLPWSFKCEDITLGEKLTVWVAERDFPPIVLGAPFIQKLVRGSKLEIVSKEKHFFVQKPDHLFAILAELIEHSG